MFNIFKKKELIRRPIITKFFIRICNRDSIGIILPEIEKDINKFISGKETVNINHSITFLNDTKETFSIFFQIDYVDESTLFQRLSKQKFNVMELTKNDNKANKWYHI